MVICPDCKNTTIRRTMVMQKTSQKPSCQSRRERDTKRGGGILKKIKMPKNWGKVKVGGKLVDPFAEKKCVWRERVAGIITTQCWHAFGGADFIKSFIFCPFCGRKIERITK